MKTIRLIGESREDLGTAAARADRERGFVPCVIYGNDMHLHFSVHQQDFTNLVYTPNTYLVQIEVNGSSHKAIVKDIQFHPVNDSIQHVDFFSIDDKKPVTLHLPIKLEGNSPGVREGGKLMLKIKKVKVKGYLKDMPDFVTVNIDKVELGKSIKVSELKADGIEFLDSPVNAVLSVVATRATRQAETEAAKADASGKKK